MSSDFTRKTSATYVRQTVTALAQQGIRPPAELRTALEALDAHDAARPVPVDPGDVRTAYREGRPEDAHRLALELTARPALANAWREAKADLGTAAEAVMRGHAEELSTKLARKAAPLIASLEAAAALDTADPVALLQAGRAEDAAKAAAVDQIAAELQNLYTLRNRLARGFDWTEYGPSCEQWKRPDKLPANFAEGMTHGARFLAGIRHGGQLWYPTPAESLTPSRQIGDAARAKAEKAAKDQRRAAVHAFG